MNNTSWFQQENPNIGKNNDRKKKVPLGGRDINLMPLPQNTEVFTLLLISITWTGSFPASETTIFYPTDLIRNGQYEKALQKSIPLT